MIDWADYYKERYDESREEIQEFHFTIGYIKGSLKRISDMIALGDIKTDSYSMEQLKSIASVVETAKEQARLNTIRVNSLIEENSKVAQ